MHTRCDNNKYKIVNNYLENNHHKNNNVLYRQRPNYSIARHVFACLHKQTLADYHN